MADTAIILRTELERARPVRRNLGFPPELRERVGRWAVGRRREGVDVRSLSEELGVSTTSIRAWSRAVERPGDGGAGRFLPLTVRSTDAAHRATEGPVLRAPGGYQVTGLQVEEIITVLRGLE